MATTREPRLQVESDMLKKKSTKHKITKQELEIAEQSSEDRKTALDVVHNVAVRKVSSSPTPLGIA